MQELQIKAVVPLEKGRLMLRFDNGIDITLYKGELRSLPEWRGGMWLKEGSCIPAELYEKLKKNGYPQECIEEAVAYVKKFHYIDDLRYAKHYVRYHQQKKSRQRMKMDLLQKGVAKSVIDTALEEEFDSDERQMIRELLVKRHYDAKNCDGKEQQRMYQFLMRRGFKSGDILSEMHCI